ncbi:exonuclease domain-containing protein [Nocardia fluminea]|uniref:3'-5' exonuclease n=1 Tax=Nocardia fluminea TaxID=134984 RepID=UPI00364B2CF5
MKIPNALRGIDIAVSDIEGNGCVPPEIIELAILTPTGDAVIADEMKSWLIRPRNAITPIVTRRVHGITNADVANSPLWADVAEEVDGLLADQILVAHNAAGDRRVLSAHLPMWEPPLVIDTVRLAKNVWPDLYGGYSLENLVRHAELDRDAIPGQRHHRAGWDAWATWQVLARLVDDSGYEWDQVIHAAALTEYLPKHEQVGLW